MNVRRFQRNGPKVERSAGEWSREIKHNKVYHAQGFVDRRQLSDNWNLIYNFFLAQVKFFFMEFNRTFSGENSLLTPQISTFEENYNLRKVFYSGVSNIPFG